MKSYILFFYLCLLSTLAFSQDLVTITDPEIEFSFRAPNDWVAQDDGYYYLLIIPNSDGLEYLSITYFETNETSPDDQFEGITKGQFPEVELNYKLLETGNVKIDGQVGKWAVFNSTFEGREMKNMLYMFIGCGQIFRIRGTVKRENFEKFQAEIKSTILSLKARRV